MCVGNICLNFPLNCRTDWRVQICICYEGEKKSCLCKYKTTCSSVYANVFSTSWTLVYKSFTQHYIVERIQMQFCTMASLVFNHASFTPVYSHMQNHFKAYSPKCALIPAKLFLIKEKLFKNKSEKQDSASEYFTAFPQFRVHWIIPRHQWTVYFQNDVMYKVPQTIRCIIQSKSGKLVKLFFFFYFVNSNFRMCLWHATH